jgi:hypothetical protein
MDNPETLASLSTQATIQRETNNTNVKTHGPQTNTKLTVHALANSKQHMSLINKTPVMLLIVKTCWIQNKCTTIHKQTQIA